MSIAGIAKEVTTITVSAWFFGDELTPLNITGVAITISIDIPSTYTAKRVEDKWSRRSHYRRKQLIQAHHNLQRAFYRSQGYPVFKAVLIAITTYEVLYYSWLYLESLETKIEKEGTE